MGGHVQFRFEALKSDRSKPDPSELDHVEPNEGLDCQIMWELCPSEILHSEEWQFLTHISGRPIGLSFKGQEIQNTEQSTMEVAWHNILLKDLVLHLIS